MTIFLAPVASVASYATWVRLRGWDEAHGIHGPERLAPIFAAERASQAALDFALVSIAPAFVLALLVLRSDDTRTRDALSTRIGAARRRGQGVTLLVGAATAASAPDR